MVWRIGGARSPAQRWLRAGAERLGFVVHVGVQGFGSPPFYKWEDEALVQATMADDNQAH
jgi:hypothetical protein